MDLTLPGRLHYASTSIPLRSCYDPTTTMKIWLRLVFADGDVAATLLTPPIPLDGASATIRNFGQNDANRSRNGKSVVEAQ